MVRAGLFILLLTATVSSHAQEAAPAAVTSATPEGTTQQKLDEVKAEAPKKNFGVTASVATSSNLRGAGDYQRSLENIYTLVPTYTLNDRLTVSAAVVFSHNLIQSQESDFANTKLKLSHKKLDLIKEKLSYTPAISATAPTNERSREEQSLRAAVALENSLSFSLKSYGAPASLSYGLGLSRNIHEFDRNNLGTPNIAYNVSNSLALGWEISSRVSLGVSGAFISGFTYTGSPRSRFELGQEIGYAAADNLSLAVGHSNGGSTLKSDLASSNIEVFNNNTSSVYGALTFVY